MVSVETADLRGPLTFVLVMVTSAGVCLTVFVTVTGLVTVPCSVFVFVWTLVCGQLHGLILYNPSTLGLALSTMVEVSVVLKF